MVSRKSHIWHFIRRLLVLLVLVSVILGTVGWYKLFREVPQQLHSNSMEEYFKYGSIGTENAEGVPYYIWMVLPRMFPEYLPKDNLGIQRGGGYMAFGFAWEAGRETPVGFSKKQIGFPRIAVNCAVCHSATYRTKPTEIRRVIATGPAVQTDVLAYVNFLGKCAADPRFNPSSILGEIEYDFELSWLDKLLYRYIIIPQTKKAMIAQSKGFQWTTQHGRSPWGPGRIEPFNPVKFNQLEMQDDGTLGTSDMMPIWNMKNRTGPLHWDGLNTDLAEVVYSGAIGDGATNKSLPYDRLNQIVEYLKTAKPPVYPFEIKSSDEVEKGRRIYMTLCADCHVAGQKQTNTVIKHKDIATDRHRADMWTDDSVERYLRFSDGYPWDFKHFQNVEGYVATPLDGLWLRAPYLHNGSVPSIEELLKPSRDRVKTFYRGYDVYDSESLGFLHSQDDPNVSRFGWKFDTNVKGNSNQGHEGSQFGTELNDHEKKSLIEFLKTL